MSSQSSGPPNPRHAKYRQLHVHPWSGCPLTIFLITICVIVGIFTKLGEDHKPVRWMYFAEQPFWEHGEKLEKELAKLEEAGDYESEEYLELADKYYELMALKPPPFQEIQKGQVWRVLTPMFLHFGPFHLIFNMIWLWTLGRMLEPVLRKLRYILLITFIGIGSHCTEAVIGGTNFGGMSGVICGMFGFVVIHSRIQPMSVLRLEPKTVRFMLIWLVLCFTGLLGPIANWAHLFGLLTGGALGIVHALRSGGLQTLKRRYAFRKAIVSGQQAALHQCVVCKVTDHHNSSLEFRVCEDGNEYCENHLPEGISR